MGKVKDGTQASKPAKPSAQPAKGGKSARNRFAPFLTNLLRADLYKPLQGRLARLWTAGALGVVVGVGVWRLSETLIDFQPPTRFGIPALIGAVLGWLIFRLVQYPPFVEFLIATEAEMNKVSWTSRAELYRATVVVLVTVLIVAVYLFGVDTVWSALLQAIGVLRFSGQGDFGSQAG
jgi:preprotein translocase subunit SecE